MFGLLRTLTTRGQTFLALGVVGVVLCLLAGERDLAWVGLLVVLLPLLSGLVMRLTPLHLQVNRGIDNHRLVLGERTVAHLLLRKTGGPPITVRVEDGVPSALGRRPRFAITQNRGATRHDLSYPLVGLQRGRHRIGPLRVRALDPFGLTSVDRVYSARDDILVTPAIHALSPLTTIGGSGTTGDATRRIIALTGQDDVLVREYRLGDDIRRIHWRSTAKYGDIMVRREEQTFEPTATILLDNRSSRHAGTGRGSSFEWAVSTAASVAEHLVQAGYRVLLVDADGRVTGVHTSEPQALREELLLRLSTISLTHSKNLEAALAGFDQRVGELLVAITGDITTEDAETLVAALRDSALGLAIVVDSDSFESDSTKDSAAPGAAPDPTPRRLRAQGWRVVQVERGDRAADAWRALDLAGVR